MQKILFGRTLLLDLGFLTPSSWTMGSSLTVKSLGDIALIWIFKYSTVAYRQGNWQAKVVNKVIVNGFKKRLDEANGKWVEELPHVLSTYRTTPR